MIEIKSDSSWSGATITIIEWPDNTVKKVAKDLQYIQVCFTPQELSGHNLKKICDKLISSVTRCKENLK